MLRPQDVESKWMRFFEYDFHEFVVNIENVSVNSFRGRGAYRGGVSYRGGYRGGYNRQPQQRRDQQPQPQQQQQQGKSTEQQNVQSLESSTNDSSIQPTTTTIVPEPAMAENNAITAAN